MTSSKKNYSLEAWEKKINDVEINKTDLNRLVMDYLVIEGYKDAAEKFAQESGTNPGLDLNTVSDRMATRLAIQSGNVQEAIERANELNHLILDENPELYFHLQQQKLIELIRDKKIDEAIQFARDELAPRGEENREFLFELERTMALLAFDDFENCPVRELLEPSQRQKTASELNAAILTSQCQDKDPKLPNVLKMLLWAEEQLAKKCEFPRLDLQKGQFTKPG